MKSKISKIKMEKFLKNKKDKLKNTSFTGCPPLEGVSKIAFSHKKIDIFPKETVWYIF